MVRVQGRLTTQVCIEHGGFGRDFSGADEVDQTSERLPLLDKIGDHGPNSAPSRIASIVNSTGVP